MFCTNCGRNLEDGTQFCIYCGAPVEEDLRELPPRKKIWPWIVGVAVLLALVVGVLFILHPWDAKPSRGSSIVIEMPSDEKETEEKPEKTGTLSGEAGTPTETSEASAETSEAPAETSGGSSSSAAKPEEQQKNTEPTEEKSACERNGHDWKAATCTEPKTCTVCGATEGSAKGHSWKAATCTEPKTCTVCGAKEGSALGHDWAPATYTSPETCKRCGTTRGTALTVSAVYLTDMPYSAKFGKLYVHTKKAASWTSNNDYRDETTNGNIYPARDRKGTYYENGFHLDGSTLGPYYITYDLEGKYTRLYGYYGVSYSANLQDIKGYKKYFEIYADGKLIFTSATMKYDSSSQYFSIDVTGVKTLRIQYSATEGSNDLAVIYEAKLE